MNIILGAGIAGLGAYIGDKSCHIYEQNDVAGGLCGGFKKEGFTFDNAVHLSFSKELFVRELFDKTEQYYHKPMPYSWLKSRWLRHPAQNNLYPLPVEEKISAVKGFIERTNYPDGDNFKDWNISRYGKYMWDNLFYPYNTKYWCVPLEELGISWIGNRIYQPSLEEVLYGSYTDKTPNTYYASEMRYPVNGGYYSYIEDIVKHAQDNQKLHYNMKAIRINPKEKTVLFSNGALAAYDKLYSSIPLPELIAVMENVPEEIKSISEGFAHTGVVIVSVGLNKIVEDNKLWFYIYDTDILASRAYFPSNKSKNNAPEGCSSIQFEIYFNGKSNPICECDAVDNCVYALEKLGIAQKEDILFSDYRILPYGNVVMLKETEKHLPSVREYVENSGIELIGRFGRWEYMWSDQSLMSGYKAARSIYE